MNTPTIKELQKKLRESDMEREELRAIRDVLVIQKKSLEASKNLDDQRKYALYDSYVQERGDLLARVLRIDQRIMALGFYPPDLSFSASAGLLKRQTENQAKGCWRHEE